MQNKYFKFFIIALAVVIIVPQIALAAWWNPFSWGIWNSILHFQQQAQKSRSPIVGNDKDVHGCIGSAGYTWCEAKQKCLRTWEEKCEVKSLPLTKDEIDSGAYSNDKNYFAYIKETSINLYDLRTDTTKTIGSISDLSKWMPYCVVKSFSPDKKYVLIDCGTSLLRSITVVDVSVGEQAVSFLASGEYFWINNKSIIFDEPQGAERACIEGAQSGISILDITTKKVIILKQADSVHEYYLNKIISDSTAVYTLTTFSNSVYSNDCASNKYTKSYWIMDLTGKIIKQINNPNSLN